MTISSVTPGLALLLAITLLPPFDFFRGAWDDPNYRQQFALAIGTLIGLVALAAIHRRGISAVKQQAVENTIRRLPAIAVTSDKMSYREAYLLEIIVSLLTAICAVAGEVMALNVIRSLQIDISVGGGIIVLVICLVAAQYGPNSTPAYQT